MSAHTGGTTTTARMTWLEPVKGFAITMVVVYHVYMYLDASNVDAVLGRAKAPFELFPMPAFFLIAGIFAARHRAMAFRALWQRRLVSMLYLYVLWSVIRTVFYFVIPGVNGDLGELPATDPLAVPLILVWPSSSYWFLYALFLFTLGRWLIARLPVWVQLTASGALSALFGAGVLITPNLGWNRVGALFFFFVLGAVKGREIRNAVPRARPRDLALVATLFVVVTAMIMLGLRRVPPLVLIGQLAALATAILVSAYLVKVRPFGALGSRALDVLETLGNNSLKIYLLHMYIIAAVTGVISSLHPDWPRWVDVLVQLGLTLVTIVGSLMLARQVSRVRWLFQPPALFKGPRRPSGRAVDQPGPAAPLSRPTDDVTAGTPGADAPHVASSPGAAAAGRDRDRAAADPRHDETEPRR